MRASAAAGGSGSVSAGTCHAPHTTATRSCALRAARSTCRMCASRRSSCSFSRGGGSGRGLPHHAHRRGDRLERRHRVVGRRRRSGARRRPPTSVPGRRTRRPRRARRSGRAGPARRRVVGLARPPPARPPRRPSAWTRTARPPAGRRTAPGPWPRAPTGSPATPGRSRRTARTPRAPPGRRAAGTPAARPAAATPRAPPSSTSSSASGGPSISTMSGCTPQRPPHRARRAGPVVPDPEQAPVFQARAAR